MPRRILASLVAIGLGLPLAAQEVGSTFPFDFDLDGFEQTGAESLADYQGRAVLIEFFAYW